MKTHGESGTKVYHAWQQMIQRCYHPKTPVYPYYGGRGIGVCQEWRDSYESFSRWAKENGHAEGLQLDRIDNNGDYGPDNCRWATRSQNHQNKRNNVLVTAFGETKCVAEWVRDARCTVDRRTIKIRLAKGLPPDLAIGEPSSQGKPIKV